MKFASISGFGLAMALNASITASLSTCTADSYFCEEEANVRCVAVPIDLSGGHRIDSAYMNGFPLEGNKLKGFVALDSDWMKSGNCKSIVWPSLPCFEYQSHSLFLD
jgi:hypothetical protein